MVVIKNLSVQNIRSHDKFEIELSPTITVITGNNGSGKTSLVEALYIALQGTSFKGSNNDVLRHNTLWWRIKVDFDDKTKRTITFNSELNNKRKKFIVDNKDIYRLVPKYRYPVVLFEPDDLRLLHGSPARRRQFIDRFISQLDPVYLNSLHKYERALRQRNNLLKKQFIQKDELFSWDITLSEHGAYIIEKRIVFIEQLNSHLNEAYDKIAKSGDNISVHYSHTYIGDIKQKLLNDLNLHQDRDRIVGFTSTGPHRHDVVFQFNDSPALSTASRGEVRSIVLALKFLEVDIIEQITGQKPVILLDDVFSELDEIRQNQLLAINNQTIISSVKLPDICKREVTAIEL